jgi:flagellar hook-associated protein 3 FlgL
MGRIYEGGTGAREAIANSLAAGGVTNLMTELQLHYQTIQGGLNAQHQGSYLFGGGNSDDAPATASTMADLAAAPSTASTFANDTLKQKSRIDENTLVETGFVASELGGGLTDVFRTIQSYQNGNAVVIDGVTYTPAAPGSITGKPTAEVEAFLKATLKALDAANTEVTNQTAKNGLVQNQVKSALDAHESQKIALEKLMNDKTGYDPAQAVTDLQMAQVAIQASAQVINTLRSTSLLDLLR